MTRAHIPPTWAARQMTNVHRWQNVSVCSCGMHGLREDIHPVNPCPLCGSTDLQNVVGRWVDDPHPWWAFWRKPSGRWLTLTPSSRKVAR